MLDFIRRVTVLRLKMQCLLERMPPKYDVKWHKRLYTNYAAYLETLYAIWSCSIERCVNLWTLFSKVFVNLNEDGRRRWQRPTSRLRKQELQHHESIWHKCLAEVDLREGYQLGALTDRENLVISLQLSISAAPPVAPEVWSEKNVLDIFLRDNEEFSTRQWKFTSYI